MIQLNTQVQRPCLVVAFQAVLLALLVAGESLAVVLLHSAILFSQEMLRIPATSVTSKSPCQPLGNNISLLLAVLCCVVYQPITTD
jgi:hypothetical protein